MSEFKYPMWFKPFNDNYVVRFCWLNEGTVVVGGEHWEKGYFSNVWYPHIDSFWLNVTDQYKDKEEITPLELFVTPFSVKKKERYSPTLKEAFEKLIKEERPNKYKRKVPSTEIDVYDILKAFDVTNPAVQHAVKKLLCAGARGYKDKVQDLKEAFKSIERAIELEDGND